MSLTARSKLLTSSKEHYGCGGALRLLRAYFSLTKPRVMVLSVFTAFAGMHASGQVASLHPFIFSSILLSISLCAGCCGAINMWYDRDIDALMHRTRRRPLPAGILSSDEVLSFGLLLGGGGVILMILSSNAYAGLLLLAIILFYIVIYTMWLKRTTPYNVVIGGISGALPPVVGELAISGEVTHKSLLLALIIFLWTPPHSWALAAICADDYARAKVPMMPRVAGLKKTKIQMVIYLLPMLVTGFLPFALTGLIWHLWIVGALSIIFLLLAIKLFSGNNKKAMRQFFVFSILYLFILFSLTIAQ